MRCTWRHGVSAPPRRALVQPIRCQRVELQHIRGGVTLNLIHRGSPLSWASQTGATLWAAALVAADFLSRPDSAECLIAHHPQLAKAGPWSWEGKEVVELGCGLGLLSITTAFLGGRVVATDGDAGVVSAAKANIREVAAAHALDHVPRTLQLQWGNEQALRRLAVPRVDVILGTELIYGGSFASWEKLAWTLQQLAGKDTLILLAESVRVDLEGRQGAAGYDEWFSLLEAAGFGWQEVPPEQLDGSLVPSPTKLWVMHRRAAAG